MRLEAYVEAGARRTFAGAIDWPGWCRSGRSEPDALASLVAYAARYRGSLEGARGHRALPPGDPAAIEFEVVERLPGGSGTDFGVPSHAPGADGRPLDATDAERLLAILESAWHAFDAAASAARGHGLRLGPRGGGRDVARIVEHVHGADAAYLAQLGSRPPRAEGEVDPQAVRRRAADAVRALASGRAIEEPSRVSRPWLPRYYVRRAAWHALDHAWEIEDRRID